MKHGTTLVAVVLFAGLLSAADPKGEGVKITDKDWKFEVQFPTKPTESLTKDTKMLAVEHDGGKQGVRTSFRFESLQNLK